LYYSNIIYSGNSLRDSEISFAISNDGEVIIIYSKVTDTNLGAILRICKTLFVCVLLTAAAVLFETDTKYLVLEPLEVMIEIVENVARDPINAKETERVQSGLKSTVTTLKRNRKEEQSEKYEVKIIQSAIVKISALLAIGFGEAGGEIITANLSNYQDLNSMLAGKKKTAIFGFCDIRGFASVNEILQEKTMVFVNEIADIVHSSVDRYGGAANKNIGDAFLMVWKFSNKFNARRDTLIEYDSKKNATLRSCQTQANMAVLGYLKIIIRINKDNRILSYKENPEIKEKMHNYKVNMGFGLHIGWAIEGAVGSTFKIDASYLSPNVNMAARLEAATRQYGVTILISGQLYEYLSDELKKICRHIDTVEVKGSKVPIKLYTIDVNLNLKVSRKEYNLTLQERTKMYKEKKSILWKEIDDAMDVSHVIFSKKTFKELLRTGLPKRFNKFFSKGMDNYIGGKWGKASKYFKECLSMANDDRPTKVILNYMEEYNNVAPSSWNGFRTLTSK
jgi:class 3 adenylate cyclase